jgi:hypothetical protein
MEYTLSQFRDIAGLSVETHRHWKRILPPVRRRAGRSPCFTLGDLIAGLLVRRLTEEAGVRVGHLVDVADGLFDLCSSPWASLEGTTLVLDLRRRTFVLSKGRASQPSSDFSLICRMEPILAEVRARLLKDQSSTAQGSLPFPPIEVAVERPQRRA